MALHGAQVALHGAQVALQGAQVALQGAQVALQGAQVALHGAQEPTSTTFKILLSKGRPVPHFHLNYLVHKQYILIKLI